MPDDSTNLGRRSLGEGDCPSCEERAGPVGDVPGNPDVMVQAYTPPTAEELEFTRRFFAAKEARTNAKTGAASASDRPTSEAPLPIQTQDTTPSLEGIALKDGMKLAETTGLLVDPEGPTTRPARHTTPTVQPAPDTAASETIRRALSGEDVLMPSQLSAPWFEPEGGAAEQDGKDESGEKEKPHKEELEDCKCESAELTDDYSDKKGWRWEDEDGNALTNAGNKNKKIATRRSFDIKGKNYPDTTARLGFRAKIRVKVKNPGAKRLPVTIKCAALGVKITDFGKEGVADDDITTNHYSTAHSSKKWFKKWVKWVQDVFDLSEDEAEKKLKGFDLHEGGDGVRYFEDTKTIPCEDGVHEVTANIPLVPLSIDETVNPNVMTYEHTKYMVNLEVCDETLIDYTDKGTWLRYKVNAYDSSK